MLDVDLSVRHQALEGKWGVPVTSLPRWASRWGGNQTFQSRALTNLCLQSFSVVLRDLQVGIPILTHGKCQWVISRDWSLIGRDKSTSGIARRTLRRNKTNRDRGLVDFDFQDKSTSKENWSMSTYPSVAEVDTDLSKASGACPWHLSRAGQVTKSDIQLFNLEG